MSIVYAAEPTYAAAPVILRTAFLKLPTDSYGKLECHSELLTELFSKGSRGHGTARQGEVAPCH